MSEPKTTSRRGRPRGAFAWPGHAAKLASSLITTCKSVNIDAGLIDEYAVEVDNMASEAALAIRQNQTEILAVAAQMMKHCDSEVVALGIRLAQLGDAEAAIKALLDIRHVVNDQRQKTATVGSAAGDSAARIAAALVGEYWQNEHGGNHGSD